VCPPGRRPGVPREVRSGIGDREAAAAVGPEVDLCKFGWTLEVSSTVAAAGERRLRIETEGDVDDGTTWVVYLDFRAGRADEISSRGQFWSGSESVNTLRDAVRRLAPEPPDVKQ
jgi:hypothetical protein